MIELVLTQGPGVIRFHGVVPRDIAMCYVSALPDGCEILMSPTDKEMACYHG